MPKISSVLGLVAQWLELRTHRNGAPFLKEDGEQGVNSEKPNLLIDYFDKVIDIKAILSQASERRKSS